MLRTFTLILNKLLASLYLIVSSSIFIMAGACSCILPGLLVTYIVVLLARINMNLIKRDIVLFLFGAWAVSFMMLISLINMIRYAISVPLHQNKTKDPILTHLIEEVAKELNTTPFYAIHLNSEVDISTFYIGKHKSLNLSLPFLSFLTKNELKAVIFHEYTHHHGGSMLLQRTHYRTMIFFATLMTSISKAYESIEDLRKDHFVLGYLMRSHVFSFLPLLFILIVCRLYLNLMSIILNNPKYEYYCDSVAAQYVGGNILASALQKVLDLQLANELILKDIQARNDDFTFELNNRSYLRTLDAMIKDLRELNPKYRVDCFNMRTTSHPSLKSRIERVGKFNIVLDESKPILSKLEVEDRIDDLPDSEYLTIAREIVRQRQEEKDKRLNEELEKNNRLRVLQEGASNSGKAEIILRWIRDQKYWIRHNVIVDGKCVDEIGPTKEESCVSLKPGLHTLSVATFLCGLRVESTDVIELALLDGQCIEFECTKSSASNALMIERKDKVTLYVSPHGYLQPSQVREQLQQRPYWLYFSFNGRVSRKTFQLKFLLPFFLIQLLLSKTQSILIILVNIFLLFPFLGMTIKRFHDRDKSAFDFFFKVYFLGFICFLRYVVSIILDLGTDLDSPNMYVWEILSFFVDACFFALLGHTIFLMTFLKGTNGPNKYGPKP